MGMKAVGRVGGRAVGPSCRTPEPVVDSGQGRSTLPIYLWQLLFKNLSLKIHVKFFDLQTCTDYALYVNYTLILVQLLQLF
jgi:hypothetical protein